MKLKLSAAGMAGLAFAATVHAQTNHYVSLTGGNIAPYTNWATAATTIQAAIDASGTNDIIWVTNGIYQTGGVTNWPAAGNALTNRVAIYKPVIVRSVNGPGKTAIRGNWNAATTNGPDAVRCVYLAAGAELHGFTISNGATFITGGDGDPNRMGGGIYGYGVVSNCLITYNSSTYLTPFYGGGVAQAYDCDISFNVAQYGFAYGGGVRDAILYNCRVFRNTARGSLNYGGGVYGGRAYNCLIYSNYTSGSGGGVRLSTVYNSTILYNTAGSEGGGGELCHFYNCLIAGNTAGNGGGVEVYTDGYTNYNCTIVGNTAGGSGGGAYVRGGRLEFVNCILYNNMGGGSNYSASGGTIVFNYCDTAPLPAGLSNISLNPKFVVPGSGYGPAHVLGNYRLDIGSPCVNAGTNFPWQALDPLGYGRDRDLDGQPRLRGPTVDMGAYEQYIPPGTIFMIRGSR